MPKMCQSLSMLLLLSVTGVSGRFQNFPTAIWKNMVNLEPEVTMSLPEMVQHYGYPIEVHSVTTEDGYILTNHRIPHGRNGQQADSKKLPVLLLHGAYASSDIWVSNVPDKSLGFLLADAGFDVWMLNCRGNFHSRKHVTLKECDAAFWDFSLDQLANYDTAAFIDDVINKTRKSQVYVVGHSMGGGSLFALLADRPEYNVKIRKLYALSPAGTLVGTQGLLSELFKHILPLLNLMKVLGINEFGSTKDLPSELAGVYAKYFEPLFQYQVFFLVGPSPDSWNATRAPIYSAHGRSSIALNCLIQFVQRLKHPAFRHFDWGEKRNLANYGQPTPPDYDLSKVNVPTRLFYATSDYLISKENVEFFQNNIGNAVDMSIAGRSWNHVCYFWATDAGVFFNNITDDVAMDNARL